MSVIFVHNMAGGTKKTRLQWIKGLMLFSQALLLLFTVQWLESQYNDQQARLKVDLTRLFTNVQQRITDSILLTNVIDPSLVNKSALNCEAQEDTTHITLSPQGMHRILAGNNKISKSEEKRLFRLDTIVFNEIFTGQMKNAGWNFNAAWINNGDSNTKAANAIFIKSDFFTSENGVVVSDYKGYLWRRMVPQILFISVLLTLTAAAFILTYKSLKSQIKLSELKDDFISNMSHELKTPIATVKVTLEALNNFNVIDDPTRSREYLNMATSEMDRLELLATRVLNTSLLDAGKIDLQKESCDLRALVQNLIQSIQPRLAQQNASIAFEATGNSFQVPVDKLHIQGVLVNLVDNSLKYGQAPVRIMVKLAEENGRLQLALTDNGPGIPEEYKEKVFEKFFRVPAGNRHNAKGHGLGLNYARQIMALHNGNINVDNVADGGCMFTLSF